MNMANRVRTHTYNEANKEHFYSSDSEIYGSKWNSLPKAHPPTVYRYFKAGLMKNIYPSPNLQELEDFPFQLLNAIKQYKEKASPERDIFLNIISSTMDWDERKTYEPYMIIKMGRVPPNFVITDVPVKKETTASEEEFMYERINNLRQVFYEIRKMNKDSEKRINYRNRHILLLSYKKGEMIEELNRIVEYEIPFLEGEFEASEMTKKLFCKRINKPVYLEDHLCKYCPEERLKMEEERLKMEEARKAGDVSNNVIKSQMYPPNMKEQDKQDKIPLPADRAK
jgi:hypothetical protein